MLRYSWKTIITAGAVAGLVFVVMEMVLVGTVGGGSPWAPPRMMGAIALGTSALPPPATFDAAIFAVGMLVHFGLSIILAAIFAALVGSREFSITILAILGAAFGLAVYVVNFYGFTAVFPWFEMARNWITILAHLVFGAVLGWWLSGRANRPAARL